MSDTAEFTLSIARLVDLVVTRRRLILGAVVAGGLLAGTVSLLTPRKYQSTATFLPEETQAGGMDLAAAARQLGIGIQAPRSSWPAGTYVEVLQSPSIMKSLAQDTVVVAEEGGRRAALLDVLEIAGADSGWRVERAAKLLLQEVVGVSESRVLGTVRVTAETKWPSVSFQIVDGLLRRVHAFNQLVRQRRAAEELRFADQRAREAEAELEAAEDRLLRFLERNRVIEEGSVLAFERARVQREVTLKQQVHAQLVVAREDARLRQVRDTPLITMLQEPTQPTTGLPRGTVFRGILGGLAGFALAFAVALASELLRDAERYPGTERAGAVRAVAMLLPERLRRWLA